MDLLASRYADMDYIMDLDAEFGIALIEKILDERDREKAWDMWLMNYQHMDKHNFVPFGEFFEKLRHPRITSYTPKGEILARAEAIKKADQEKRRRLQ